MVEFIKKQIEKAAKKSIESGQDKYRAYFIKTRIYEEFRLDVEALLISEGYEDCIVTE